MITISHNLSDLLAQSGAPDMVPNAASSVAAANESMINNWVNYTFQGNEIWRFGLLLLVILATVFVGKIVRSVVLHISDRFKLSEKSRLLGIFIECSAGPLVVLVFAIGVYISQFCFVFAENGRLVGFSTNTHVLWGKVAHAVAALALAYFMYRLVDIVEFYLKRISDKTETVLDDMLVPLIRKSLRIFIAVITGMFIADNILDMDISSILAAAGIGGLAFALAAKDTLQNVFGSITIFADRPFNVGERIGFGGFDGVVEDVGFRSTRIRTLDGHLVSVPNSKIANESVENISRRPYIKRVMNLTLTYSTSPEKMKTALAIVKDVLAKIEEINNDPDLVPRVYFTDFKDWALNILAIYWVKPADYWLYLDINQRVNMTIMQQFEAEGIEFAFPTQTVYVNNSN